MEGGGFGARAPPQTGRATALSLSLFQSRALLPKVTEPHRAARLRRSKRARPRSIYLRLVREEVGVRAVPSEMPGAKLLAEGASPMRKKAFYSCNPSLGTKAMASS